jgi:hypothetical protein
VRLLLRVCEAIVGVFGGVVGGLKVGIGIRAIRSIFDTSGATTFGGVFAGNPALSLVHSIRVRVGVIYPCFYLYVTIQKHPKKHQNQLDQASSNPRV